MTVDTLKQAVRQARSLQRKIGMRLYLAKRLRGKASVTVENFDFETIKVRVLCFLECLRVSDKVYLYRYSLSCNAPTLYASVYACMTKSMLGALADLDPMEKSEWVAYFNSFQDPSDGLFYDPVVLNEIYADTDWWGARHLALHLISAYTDLDARPRYPFIFLKPYYDAVYLRSWLDQYDWQDAAIGEEDPDNKIMNIGCLLQYQRDTWGDEAAGATLERLKVYLREKINPATGMWGGFDASDKNQRSRMVQFAYHLFPLFFYDGDYDFEIDKLVQLVFTTQNQMGGFGVQLNSSACEDMDSIDLLVRLFPLISENCKADARARLARALSWVFLNQVKDGGFVFRLNEPFAYGSLETSSVSSEGAGLPTWFRTLCIAYLVIFFRLEHRFIITRCPGYEF